MSVPDTYAVRMGANWRHNFDRFLHIINPSAIYGVIVERADGQYVSFSSSAGTYTTDTDLDYKLTKSGSTWTLTDPDDTVETYTASGAIGTLNTIKLRNGYTQTMSYTSGKLTGVSDSYSRALGLTYSSVGMLASVTTPDSLTLNYGYIAYSSAQRLATVSYSTSPVTKQTYLYENVSYPFALTGITDENNKRYATWTYDNKGRAISSQLASGVNFTSVTYDDVTGNRLVKGPLGIVETYKFTNLQGVPKVTEIDRASNGTVTFSSRKFSYDSNGFTKTATDWNGNQTAYTNNSHGLPTQIVYASGSAVTNTTSITYDSTWARLAHVITTPGLTSTLNYDSSGNLATRVLSDTTSQSIPYSTNGQNRTWTYTYTSSGLLTSVQLPRTDVTAKTTLAYTGGTLTSITDALSHVTTINTSKPGGLPLTMHDPNNVLTTLAYSPRLWLTSSVMTTSSGALTSSFTYDSAGNLTKTTLPDASYLAYAYDNAHRPITITNRLSETQNITYNSAGNMTQALWKNASAVTKRQHTGTFDALGRALTDVGGMSQTTTFGYDSDSNVTSIKDPLLHMAYQTFDQLNRLKTYRDAALNLSTITYDAHDRPLTVTDPKGNATSYVYDGFGETIQETSPDRGTTVYHYDKDGNLSSKTDAASAVTNYTYDALDRLLTRAYPADATLNASLTYDQTTGHGSGIGRLTSLTDQAGSLSLAYEQRGLVTSNSRTISATAYTTGYTYESAGRLASVTYPTGGWSVNYARDNAGQVSGVTATQPSHSPVNVVTSVTHMPFGPLAGWVYANTITDTRTYDLDYRMTQFKDMGTGIIDQQTYTYDADNNVLTIVDGSHSANNQTLTYDAIDRLKSAAGIYGTISSITYDSNSNRLTYGGTSYTVPSTSNRMSNAGGSAITYTSTGNINAISTNTMTYNKANQLATATVSATASTYLYDAFGQRLKTTVGAGTPNVYEYDQAGNLLTETNSGTETDYVWLDGMPITAIQPGAATIAAVMPDHLGTPQHGANAAKTTVWEGTYQPFGAVTPSAASITMNLRMPGQHVDATGYYHNGFRDYNPAVGRYLQSDPIGLGGGLNTYNYAAQNPYKWTDRHGLCAGPLAILCAEGIIAVAPEALEALSAGAAEVAAELEAAEAGSAALPVAAGSASLPQPATTPGGQCSVGSESVNLASQEATNHILYGDKFGGGHLFPGLPTKTPFPANWSPEQIMEAISDVATNPTSASSSSFAGRTAVVGNTRGIQIKVILDSPENGGDIMTGFPTNLPRNR